MTTKARYVAWAIIAALLAASLYLYRTLELDRGDAQPVLLDILNPAGEMVGPGGIQFDAAGDLYVGDAQGTVWVMEHGGSPRVYADMAKVRQPAGGLLAAGAIPISGIAFDSRGNLYVAGGAIAGGSVLRLEPGTKVVDWFARDVGVAQCVAIGTDGRHLWVSDHRRHGRVLRYPLTGAAAAPDLIVPDLEYPSGMVFGRNGTDLYVAESHSGDITRIDTAGDRPRLERVVNLRGAFAAGSLSGLAFDPRDGERRFLYVAENLRGILTVVDLVARPARIRKSFRLALMGGRPCPASLTIRDGYLYFTDLWACSPVRILLGIPRWHNHVYRFRVLDLALLPAGTQ